MDCTTPLIIVIGHNQVTKSINISIIINGIIAIHENTSAITNRISIKFIKKSTNPLPILERTAIGLPKCSTP